MKESRKIGAVIIGRNEGERLIRCLQSVGKTVDTMVYVDSGSTDDSLAAAREAGALTVELDMTVPFTAARARNEGFRALQAEKPVDYVQMIDGDCELQPDWIATAQAFLDANPDAAIACGRRRERFPEATIYNRMCDYEWDTPIGDAKACGGDTLIRATALEAVGGYNPSLIAGEEPEMCVRLRAAGWRVHRLDAEMTLHDAAMTRFGQWWKRSRRAGHAYAEGASIHGSPPERHYVVETTRAIVWALVIPTVTVLGLLTIGLWASVVLLVYPLQYVRLVRRSAWMGTFASKFALFSILGKFAEVAGVLEFAVGRVSRRPAKLIEYK